MQVGKQRIQCSDIHTAGPRLRQQCTFDVVLCCLQLPCVVLPCRHFAGMPNGRDGSGSFPSHAAFEAAAVRFKVLAYFSFQCLLACRGCGQLAFQCGHLCAQRCHHPRGLLTHTFFKGCPVTAGLSDGVQARQVRLVTL